MSLRKKVFLAVMGTVIVSLMAGAGIVEAKTTVTFWTPGDVGVRVAEVQGRFEEEHPNIKLEVVRMGYGDQHRKIVTAAMAGMGAPDCFWAGTRRALAYIRLGAVIDLTEEVTPLKEDISEAFLVDFTDEGRIWGFPWDGGAATVFYRKEAFDKAGLKFPDTWDGFIEVGKKLAVDNDGDGEIDQYMLAIPTKDTPSYLRGFVQSKGFALQNKAGDFLLTQPGVVETAQWMTDLALKHKIVEVCEGTNPQDPSYWAAMKEGRYLCEMRGQWIMGWGLENLGYNSEHEWRAASTGWLSWEKDKRTGATWGGAGLMISNQTEHPEETLAAARYFCTTEEYQVWACKNYAQLPTFKPAWDIVRELSVPFLGGQKAWEIWFDELEVTPPITYAPDRTCIDQAFGGLAFDMLSGKISVADAMAEIQKQAESLAK